MDIIFKNEVNFKTVLHAWEGFRKGKRRRADVVLFERNLEQNLRDLTADLESGAYRHGAYQTFEIKDSKRRRIDKATVRDRVVHELVFRLLENLYEPVFIHDSYSSRYEKGTIKALDRLDVFLQPWRAGERDWFVVVADVKSFFATVPHERLIDIVARRVQDDQLMNIICEIVQSFSREDVVGMPLGNVTSQVFANIYLHEMDQIMKHEGRVKRYIRYNDDVVMVVRGEQKACELKHAITRAARGLDLVIKTSIKPLRTYTEFDWLGASHLFRSRTIRYDTRRRMARMLRHTKQHLVKRLVTVNYYRQVIRSYRAHQSAYVTNT